jgi:hypothetical protein
MTAFEPDLRGSAGVLGLIGRMRPAVMIGALALGAACANPARLPLSAQPPAQTVALPAGSTPFAGLWLGDAEGGGVEVLGMVAGPAALAGLMQGDRIQRIGEREVDAARARAIIDASAPGARLLLQVVRGATPLQVELVVDERERWSGPADYSAAVPYAAVIFDDDADSAGDPLEQALAAAPDAVPIARRLDRMFADLARRDTGYHKLPLIRAALERPLTMRRWRDRLVAGMRAPATDRLAHTICEHLALDCPVAVTTWPSGPVRLAQFAADVSSANARVRRIFAAAGIDRAQAVADLHYLLQKTAADRTLLRQPEVLRGIRAMQSSMRLELAGLLAVLDDLLRNAQRPVEAAGVAHAPPAALAAIVQGEILDHVEVDGGYVVVGGPGPNRYAMDRLYAVIDPGGDDVYRWGGEMPGETQTLIDLAGADRYEAAVGGPGAGWLGVSVLIDRAGDDRYESALGGCGAGAMGFGVLLDGAGADRYQCAAWSAGAALYGSGILLDQGAESDVYRSEVFSQGAGGPRGFGVLLDAGGADLYRANGPVPSAYGVPASFMAFSQGVGVGIRPYDLGGVGVLLDLGGDDRYEGGEFSQGGGYFWGVGLLHDAGGNDLYYGNRYAQGFAAHQAFGLLADAAGDDVYWSMTAAGQGAAWDQSVALLIDGSGDDVYRADALSQGAAAQQARALLHDLSGDDFYRAASEVAQGAAGENAYHFRGEDPIFSLGVLIDEFGFDRYSTRLANGETRWRAGEPSNGAGVGGIALDRP